MGAGHLLMLWIRLLQVAAQAVLVRDSMVRALLQDDHAISKSLSEWKCVAVCEIARKSENGASMIHDALQLRLHAGQVSAANILGQVIATSKDDSPWKQKFVSLAKIQLEANY